MFEQKMNMSVAGNVTQHSKRNRSMEEKFSKDESWFEFHETFMLNQEV